MNWFEQVCIGLTCVGYRKSVSRSTLYDPGVYELQHESLNVATLLFVLLQSTLHNNTNTAVIA